jgi:hypothetical protein
VFIANGFLLVSIVFLLGLAFYKLVKTVYSKKGKKQAGEKEMVV